MTKILLALVALAGGASAAPIQEAYAARLCEAIWHAEGGKKARVSHGVLSVSVRGAAHAREVCLRTIRNSWDRWEAAGTPGDFIDYLGKRYAPVGPKVKNDPRGLNRHWPRNVRSRLNSGGGDAVQDSACAR